MNKDLKIFQLGSGFGKAVDRIRKELSSLKLSSMMFIRYYAEIIINIFYILVGEVTDVWFL